jgi:magnesium-protoporphyrin O-methyltransferase
MLATYQQRRSQIQTYFDRTAAETWARLTSDAPVSRIRATVRAGRDRMRETLLSWLPEDMHGCRLLDAGCGTGALSVEAARRGAEVVAIDVAPTLVQLAQERAPRDLNGGRIDFRVGDMLDPALGKFDFTVAMDSLIHYGAHDCGDALAALAARTGSSIVFTYAPKTPLLATMHAVGKLFPRSDRAPSIQPISQSAMQEMVLTHDGLRGWSASRSERITASFYISQALELTAP